MMSASQKLPFFQPILSLSVIFFTLGLVIILLASPFSVYLVNTLLSRLVPLGQPQNLATLAFIAGQPVPSQSLSGYTPSEISHLNDVRVLLRYVLVITLVCFAVILVAAHQLAQRSNLRPLIHPILKNAGLVLMGLPLVLGLSILILWNIFFESFHQLLFPPGTYLFPPDSLLIQLYPESFWQAIFLLYAVVLFLLGVSYWGLAQKLSRAAL